MGTGKVISRKAIEESNTLVHEAYCYRHDTLCSVCGELVKQAEMNGHLAGKHRMEACRFCHSSMDAFRLVEHQNNCAAKPKTCPACKLEQSTTSYAEHFAHCSSRTDPCRKCGKRFKILELESHEAGCASSVACELCNRKFMPVDEARHRQECPGRACDDCGKLTRNPTHSQTCPQRIETCPRCSARNPRSRRDAHALECPAQRPIPSRVEADSPLLTSMRITPQVPQISQTTRTPQAIQTPSSMNNLSSRPESTMTVYVICYRCSMRISKAEFDTHLLTCKQKKCDLCQQSFPDTEYSRHLQSCAAKRMPNPAPIQTPTSNPVPTPQYRALPPTQQFTTSTNSQSYNKVSPSAPTTGPSTVFIDHSPSAFTRAPAPAPSPTPFTNHYTRLEPSQSSNRVITQPPSNTLASQPNQIYGATTHQRTQVPNVSRTTGNTDTNLKVQDYMLDYMTEDEMLAKAIAGSMNLK